jgi:integrase
MKEKLNLKIYQGKERLFIAVPQSPRISRLWIWDEKHKEYRVPENQKSYQARKWEVNSRGERKRTYRCFFTLEEARSWQQGVPKKEEAIKKGGPLFREVVSLWKKRTFPSIEVSTQISYERLLRLYFGKLMDLTLYELTPEAVDHWLDDLKDESSWTMQSKKRTTFKNELKLLNTILNFAVDCLGEREDFRFPIRNRHRKSIRLNRKVFRSKDIKEAEFLKFRETLLTLYLDENLKEKGRTLWALSTVQYYQALRISEAAALFWEDVYLDLENPKNSRIKVNKAVFWPRVAKMKSFIKPGFKNDKSSGGVKELPLFPESFHALKALSESKKTQLIFQWEGRHLEYREIQSAYDRAFKKLGLSYRGTHIMRHGGCRRVYNEEGGDLAVAQQLLGNSDLKSTLVYAKRSASALTEVAEKQWREKENTLETGDKW